MMPQRQVGISAPDISTAWCAVLVLGRAEELFVTVEMAVAR